MYTGSRTADVARPLKLTDALAEQIAMFVREGIDPQVALGSYGISRSTFYSWMAQGRQGQAPFMEFLDIIERASAEAIVMRVGRIVRAGQEGNWRASAWVLERIAPELYGKRRVSSKKKVRLKPNVPSKRINVENLEIKVSRVIPTSRT